MPPWKPPPIMPPWKPPAEPIPPPNPPPPRNAQLGAETETTLSMAAVATETITLLFMAILPFPVRAAPLLVLLWGAGCADRFGQVWRTPQMNYELLSNTDVMVS